MCVCVRASICSSHGLSYEPPWHRWLQVYSLIYLLIKRQWDPMSLGQGGSFSHQTAEVRTATPRQSPMQQWNERKIQELFGIWPPWCHGSRKALPQATSCVDTFAILQPRNCPHVQYIEKREVMFHLVFVRKGQYLQPPLPGATLTLRGMAIRHGPTTLSCIYWKWGKIWKESTYCISTKQKLLRLPGLPAHFWSIIISQVHLEFTCSKHKSSYHCINS